MRRHVALVLQVEGVDHRDAGLLHRGRGQGGRADHVARGVDVRDGGLVVLVDLDRPRSLIAMPTRSSPRSLVLPARPAETRIAFGLRTAPDLSRTSTLSPDVDRLDRVVASRTGCPSPPSGSAATADDLGVERADQPVALLDHGHVDAEDGEHAGIFAADHPAADDEHALGHLAQAQDRVRVVDTRVVEREDRRAGEGRDPTAIRITSPER